MCAALLAVPLALSGCALQADWDGAKKLASEPCVLAAQLFAGAGEGADADRAELAAALRAHVPADMGELLDIYALPEPAVRGDESEQRRAQIVEVLSARSFAEDALRVWAQLSCGAQIGQPAGAAAGGGDAPSAWPALSQLQALEGELDGVRTVKIAGAVEPDHAVALCEELRQRDAAARIEVADLDGFPLALAEPAAACGYDPILFTGLELDPENG